MNLSVIICSWQAPDTLDDALSSVFGQQESKIKYEVILVNNGFSEARASQLQRNYPSLLVIYEPRPGLTYARRAGFNAARGEFFICIDDDNILASGFFKSLNNLVEKNPNLGCICPLIVPRWERKPAEWLQEYGIRCLSYNALVDPGDEKKEQVWIHPNFKGWPRPPGGGMIIHRSVAEHYLEENDVKRLKLDRIGSTLGGSGDHDICLRFSILRRNAAYSEHLIVYHQIPIYRTKIKYLFKLLFRMTQDSVVLKRLWNKEKHPFADDSFNFYWHWHQLFHLPYAWTRVWMRTGKSYPRYILEWAFHAGFLWGWFRDWLRSILARPQS